jgi:Protein of unknown function (DUF3108)
MVGKRVRCVAPPTATVARKHCRTGAQTGCALLQIIAALVLAAVMAATPAKASDRLDLRFEVFGFAGLHILTTQTRAEVTPTGYAIGVNLETRGIASAFVDLHSHSEVFGTLQKQTPHPEAYQAEIWRNGTDRDYRLKYLADGNVVTTLARPASQTVNVDPARLRGSVDQLTAYFLVERQLARTGMCSAVIPVYDGAEFYRLHFLDVKDVALTADRHQNFAGATRLCEVVRELIVANPDRKESTYDRGRMWYARLLPDERMLPVRMEYDTAFGQVEGYLTDLDGAGVHLNFDGR